MLWLKSFHIIFMVTWFSGLFYLPRLFVYHAAATDHIGIQRFKVMERKLYYYITTPAAILTILFGLWILGSHLQGYMQMTWLHIKLGLVALLITYHICLGKWLYDFSKDKNRHSHRFYRIVNEIPALFLMLIVILAVVKPFGMVTH